MPSCALLPIKCGKPTIKCLLVLLQVEFCFTAEGTEDEGCTVSLRGLDAPIYYRQRGVLNCGHAVVRCLILDALRHWVQEYRVDGFVFVNAETLAVGKFLMHIVRVITCFRG